MAIELRQLRYFIAVAEERHVTRAAERLGMRQPPLSRQMQLIEQQLEARLFDRKPRGMELTAAGQALLHHARPIVAAVEQAVLATRQVARGEQGSLVIGLSPTIPFQPFVPNVIKAFRADFPQVVLSIQEGLSRQLLDLLRSGRIDCTFLRDAVRDRSGLAVYALPDEPMVLALPADHAVATAGDGDAAVPLASLAKAEFIAYGGPEGPGLFDVTVAACRRAGFSPRLGQAAPRITSVLGLVATGLGVALVPASMQRIRMAGVAFRELTDEPQPRAVLNLAIRRGDASAVVQRFAALVRKAARAA